jgi:hypothetical protein
MTEKNPDFASLIRATLSLSGDASGRENAKLAFNEHLA